MYKLMYDPTSFTPFFRPASYAIYRSTLPYDSDDYMQEGRILLWRIALHKNYRRGSFKKYFATAIRFHLSNLFRDYVLRNYICIGECTDFYGNTFQILNVVEGTRTYVLTETKRDVDRKRFDLIPGSIITDSSGSYVCKEVRFQPAFKRILPVIFAS